MTESAERNAEVTIPCPVCREPIYKGAKKCVRCSSMLGWRGWLGISETTLALLVALVSVLGATAPRIAGMFMRKYSDVHVDYPQVSGGGLW